MKPKTTKTASTSLFEQDLRASVIREDDCFRIILRPMDIHKTLDGAEISNLYHGLLLADSKYEMLINDKEKHGSDFIGTGLECLQKMKDMMKGGTPIMPNVLARCSIRKVA